jgi:hypothetical protein
MADNGDDGEDDLAVELGEGEPVRGMPLARVASRLSWPIEASEIRRKEGQSEVRTAHGTRPIADILAEVDLTYFERRQEFVDAVRAVTDLGPVSTE